MSNITIENTGTEKVSFRYFKVNFVETLEPEDKVIITPTSSEAAEYYKALANDVLGLSVEEAEESSNEVEPTPEPTPTPDPEPEPEPDPNQNGEG